MPSGSVAELESSFDKNLSIFLSGENNIQQQQQSYMCREWGDGYTSFGSKHRIDAFGLLMSRVTCSAIWSEGMDEGVANSWDRLNPVLPRLWRRREVWEFSLEVGQMLFSGLPESRRTLVPCLVEWSDVTLGQLCIPVREGKLFQSKCLTTWFSVP